MGGGGPYAGFEHKYLFKTNRMHENTDEISKYLFWHGRV